VHRWKSRLLLPAAIVVGAALGVPLLSGQEFNLWVALACLCAFWVLLGLVDDLRSRKRPGVRWRLLLRRLPSSYWGMVFAHCGFAAVTIAVVATTQYSIERDIRMAPGDSESLAGYEFVFEDTERIRGPNYLADAARFRVLDGGEVVAQMQAEKRRYFASNSIMTEAAIDANLFRDLYVAMGEPIGDDGAWAIRLHYKPMVRWMWLGAIAMGLGAFFTVLDRRYRSTRARQKLSDKALAHGSAA